MSSHRILLLGLDDATVTELSAALTRQHYTFDSRPFLSTLDCLRLIDQVGADLVCCPARPDQYRPLVSAFKQKGSQMRLLVVTRRPQVSEWLDALEGGASDYFGPPFEPAHVSWIVESASKSAPMASYMSVTH